MDEAEAFDRTMGLTNPVLAASRRWVAERVVGQTLEVGAGTGGNFEYLPRDVPLTALDPNEALLDGARRRAAALDRDVTFVVGSGEELPYDDASFDTVLSTFALCSFPDDARGVAEMLRVLRPGGRLLLADHVISTSIVVRGLQRGLERLTRKNGEYWTRRPSLHVEGAGGVIVEQVRTHMGVVERLMALQR